MNKVTDIQEFRELSGLWLEAGTDREQERLLGELARRLQAEELEPELRADVLLAATLGAPEKLAETPGLDPAAFAAFVDETVACVPPRARRNRFRKWGVLTTSAAAAVLLAVMTLRHAEPVQTDGALEGNAVTKTAQVSARNGGAQPVRTLHADGTGTMPDTEEEAATVKAVRHPAVRATEAKVTEAEHARAVQVHEEEAETLEMREVTDPEEAALILSESCNLLASCLTKAEHSTQEAIVTLNDNINLLNLEYSEI